MKVNFGTPIVEMSEEGLLDKIKSILQKKESKDPTADFIKSYYSKMSNDLKSASDSTVGKILEMTHSGDIPSADQVIHFLETTLDPLLKLLNKEVQPLVLEFSKLTVSDFKAYSSAQNSRESVDDKWYEEDMLSTKVGKCFYKFLKLKYSKSLEDHIKSAKSYSSKSTRKSGSLKQLGYSKEKLEKCFAYLVNVVFGDGKYESGILDFRNGPDDKSIGPFGIYKTFGYATKADVADDEFMKVQRTVMDCREGFYAYKQWASDLGRISILVSKGLKQ